MRRSQPSQLPLLDLPAAPSAPRAPRRLSRAATVQHCNALLAELDRVAAGQAHRAVELARLFTAAEDSAAAAESARAEATSSATAPRRASVA
ncbi:MAG TPA: hypothetical protein VL400_19470 [Polyangiaceae bacterium]|nr:hypothetical protein [Polyangiaceae bacterium]